MSSRNQQRSSSRPGSDPTDEYDLVKRKNAKDKKVNVSSDSNSLKKTIVSPAGNDHSETESKFARVFRRVWTSVVMFAVFCGAVYMGQPVLLAIVILIQFLMFREIIHLAYSHLLSPENRVHVPLFRTQNWFYFFVTTFFIYGMTAKSIFKIDIPYHTFISFALFAAAFVGFVLTLRHGIYNIQFGMFAWVCLTLLFIVFQSTALFYNLYRGLFWFVLPAFLIISNDSWAYVWGMLFGRTPLIKLSPKKTWEGFIGALISTCLTAFFVSRYLDYPLFTCPQNTLNFDWPSCPADGLFVDDIYNLPFSIFGYSTIAIAPIQFHALALGLFASLIAPFGGFFASGFKRAYGIKDFGNLIPGHGGLTDRMDCQLIMGLFVYVYYWTFVYPSAEATTVESVFALAQVLSSEDRSRLANMLLGAAKAGTEALVEMQ